MFRILMAFVAFGGAGFAQARYDHEPIYVWRGEPKHAHELAPIAACIQRESAADEFRRMIAAVRNDVDAVIGGLMIDIPPAHRERFRRVFHVSDPIYGSYEEMARQSGELKKLLLLLGLKKVGPADLWFVRRRLANASDASLSVLIDDVRRMGKSVSMASVCQHYAHIERCESSLANEAPRGQAAGVR